MECVKIEEMLKTEGLVSAEPTMDQVVPKDRVSDLPWEILDNILGRLPIKNAVATTILSRKWKDKWVDVSTLVFDDYSKETGTMDPGLFANLVYHVFLSHRGTIEKLMLTSHSSEYNIYSKDIELWISFLKYRRSDIKELTLHFSSSCTLPTIFFDGCELLRHLCLTNCRISPQYHSSLRNLVSLQLTACHCYDIYLQDLINSCPILEKLVLANVSLKILTISAAPNLKYLSLEGDFSDIYLENCPHLSDASFKMTAEAVQGTSHNLVQPPDWLSRTRRLVMNGHFLKFLAKRYNWHGVSIACHNLEVVELDSVDFDDVDEMAVALSFLRRSSNLNILLISGHATYFKGIYGFTEAQGKCCLNKLRLARITVLRTYGVEDTRLMMGDQPDDTSFLDIVELVLACSPILENMHVHYIYLETSDLWVMRKLLLCERASSQLKFKYKSTRGRQLTKRPTRGMLRLGR